VGDELASDVALEFEVSTPWELLAPAVVVWQERERAYRRKPRAAIRLCAKCRGEIPSEMRAGVVYCSRKCAHAVAALAHWRRKREMNRRLHDAHAAIDEVFLNAPADVPREPCSR